MSGSEFLFGHPCLLDDPLTVFVYDRGQVVYQFDALAMGGFDLVSAADLSHRYLWGPQVDQLLTDEQVVSLGSEGEVLWAMTDNIGSVRDVIDSNADLRIHRQFDSFGNIVDESHFDTSGDPVVSTDPEFVTLAFAFTGRWRDEVTGLQNNLNRWYDSMVGNWISEDPLPLPFSDENPNRYANNAPMMYVDPNGMEAEEHKLTITHKKTTYVFTINIDARNKEHKAELLRLTKVTLANILTMLDRLKDGTVKGNSPAVKKAFGRPLTDKELAKVEKVFQKVVDSVKKKAPTFIDEEGKPGLNAQADRRGFTKKLSWSTGKVHFFDDFFDRHTVNEQQSILFHELTHVWGGTQDHGYLNPQTGTYTDDVGRPVTVSDPQKLNNANNFELFYLEMLNL